MPSPFPGMDPYLENPELFSGLHYTMATYLTEALQVELPEPLYATIGVRMWVEVIAQVPQDERREPSVEIYTREGSGRRLVTSMEVLSPSNKTPGEHGRDLYLRKQQEILNSKVHLVEIDLLRAGKHTTAVPLPQLQTQVGPFDYHVCIHHYDNLEDYFIYPILLEQRLPRIDIPLLPGDPPV